MSIKAATRVNIGAKNSTNWFLLVFHGFWVVFGWFLVVFGSLLYFWVVGFWYFLIVFFVVFGSFGVVSDGFW